MKRTLRITITLSVGLLIISLWGFYFAIRPFKITSPITPRHYHTAYENISFKTKDNVLIRGWFIKNKQANAKTIILLHGYPADKGDLLRSTFFLHQYYHLLYFDFRHLGESDGSYSTIGHNEILDLQAAIQYLQNRGIKDVGVWGFSLGGAVALMTAPTTPEIKAIVAEYSYARLDWMVDDYYQIPYLKRILGELSRFWAWLFLSIDIKSNSPALSAAQLKIPVLLIHSKTDRLVTFKHGLLFQQSLRHLENINSIILDEAQHGEHFTSLNQDIIDFFKRSL